MRNSLKIFFIVMVIQLLLQRCGVDEVGHSEIVGKWISKEHIALLEKDMKVDNLSYFEFFEDSTFNAVNVPAKPLYGLFPDSVTQITGSGSWRFTTYQGLAIGLKFNKIIGQPDGLNTEINIGNYIFTKLSLFLWVGEEGLARIEYEKEE